MRAVRAIIEASVVMVVGLSMASCGNDSFRSSPTLPYTPGPGYQAPPPPNGFQPPGQQPIGSPIFRPVMPPQQPPQFYPFIPMYQFMQVNPGFQQQWFILWQRWQEFAMRTHAYVYDFPFFWTQFCPTQPDFAAAYQYLDQSFYYWVQPGMQLPTTVDVDYFWGGYEYYPMECDYCY